MTALLVFDDVTVRFGGLVAVDAVTIHVEQGTIHGLIGPNGAGKTTVINTITGVSAPTSGTVSFDGETIAGLSPHAICERGLTRTFQNTELFGEMTVADNIRTGLHRIEPYGLFAAVTKAPRSRRAEARIAARVDELLETVGLADQRDLEARFLPFAGMRKLEIARALATNPRLLLLDEPAAGLRAAEIDELNVMLRGLCANQGVSILLVDHVMPVVMGVSDRITVVNFGQKIAEGAPEEVRSDPAVITAYLGH